MIPYLAVAAIFLVAAALAGVQGVWWLSLIDLLIAAIFTVIAATEGEKHK